MEDGACKRLTEGLVSIVEAVASRLNTGMSDGPSVEAMAAATIAVALLGTGAHVTVGDDVRAAARDLLQEAAKGLDKF